MSKGPTIGVLSLWFIIAISPHHPPVVIATRVMASDDLIAPCTSSHTTDTNPFIFRCQRKIDIETHPTGKGLRQDMRGYLPNEWTHRREISLQARVTKGEGHRGYIFHAPLKYDSHRTTVMYIHRGIITMIDTAYHHIRPARHQLCQSDLHTIHRRTVA